MILDTGIEGEAVRAFGVEPRRIEPIGVGRMNRHWNVWSAERRLVLRQYRPGRSAAAIDYEHRLLGHAASRGWPVAVPLGREGSGVTLIAVDGERFSMFPFLEGEPSPHGSLSHKRIKGRLLARLHHDLRDFEDRGQRDGFGRAWELDVFVQAAGEESFNALLSAFAREHPDLAAGIRREKYRNLRELARLGYGELPVAPVHCDYHHDNLLFRGAELTGLLDFDSARRDVPVFDIACSLTLECLEAPAYDAIDLSMARAFVDGYAGSRPLTEAEARLLAPLARASTLWLCMFRLLQWRQGAGPRPLASLARSVRQRFPAVEARARDLEALALEATGN